MKIGISGAQGAFSEEAAQLYCQREGIENPGLEYMVFVERVLSALEAGEIDLGIFAIENSNGGVVTEYLPAIAKHRFAIKKIFEMEVRMMLMALPGTKKEDIKTVISQNQALRQCRMYLKRAWPDADIVEYIDTATAAKDLHEGTLPKDTAVIGPRGAATLYDLDILEEGVQDMKFNFTTFIAAECLPG